MNAEYYFATAKETNIIPTNGSSKYRVPRNKDVVGHFSSFYGGLIFKCSVFKNQIDKCKKG